jgi:general transcription factor 3C polypeptide 3 (transcription factor C subunit 4)
MTMGECFMECGDTEEAESCYLTVAVNDEKDMEVRVRLARLYESTGMAEQAFKYVNEAVILGHESTTRKRKETRAGRLARELRSAREGEGHGYRRAASMSTPPGSPLESANERTSPTPLTASLTFSSQAPSGKSVTKEPEEETADHIQFLYRKLLELRPKMREGDEDITEDWLDIADALLRDFRSNRVFFPLQRHLMFLGYSREAQRKAGRLRTRTLMDEMQDMAKRLQATLGTPFPFEKTLIT